MEIQGQPSEILDDSDDDSTIELEAISSSSASSSSVEWIIEEQVEPLQKRTTTFRQTISQQQQQQQVDERSTTQEENKPSERHDSNIQAQQPVDPTGSSENEPLVVADSADATVAQTCDISQKHPTDDSPEKVNIVEAQSIAKSIAVTTNENTNDLTDDKNEHQGQAKQDYEFNSDQQTDGPQGEVMLTSDEVDLQVSNCDTYETTIELGSDEASGCISCISGIELTSTSQMPLSLASDRATDLYESRPIEPEKPQQQEHLPDAGAAATLETSANTTKLINETTEIHNGDSKSNNHYNSASTDCSLSPEEYKVDYMATSAAAAAAAAGSAVDLLMCISGNSNEQQQQQHEQRQRQQEHELEINLLGCNSQVDHQQQHQHQHQHQQQLPVSLGVAARCIESIQLPDLCTEIEQRQKQFGQMPDSLEGDNSLRGGNVLESGKLENVTKAVAAAADDDDDDDVNNATGLTAAAAAAAVAAALDNENDEDDEKNDAFERKEVEAAALIRLDQLEGEKEIHKEDDDDDDDEDSAGENLKVDEQQADSGGNKADEIEQIGFKQIQQQQQQKQQACESLVATGVWDECGQSQFAGSNSSAAVELASGVEISMDSAPLLLEQKSSLVAAPMGDQTAHAFGDEKVDNYNDDSNSRQPDKSYIVAGEHQHQQQQQQQQQTDYHRPELSDLSSNDSLLMAKMTMIKDEQEETVDDDDHHNRPRLQLELDQQQQQQQQQLQSPPRMLTPPVLVDEEDLEREFDEEPEFEQRQVEVKRNQNPRQFYELQDELGRGKFGTVYKCQELASGRSLAAKFVSMRRREDRDDVEREVAIMCQLQHKRLLQLYDAFDDVGLNEMCLIMELVEGGELFERIVDNDFDLTERKAAIFMRQICEGVEYMHSKQIVHLDMKPENVLCLSRTGNRIKLIDFGLARQLQPGEPPLRVMFGTPDFAAPEVLTYEFVTLATDMWSVGVICYVLLSGLSPFMGDNDLETMANVTRATFDFNDKAFELITDLAKDFIARLLVRQPELRLTPSECLKHAWLQRGAILTPSDLTSNSMTPALQQSPSAATFVDSTFSAGAIGALLLKAAAEASSSSSTRPRASFGGDSTSSGLAISLDKRRLKRYVVRRKWHKTVHAIMALQRMGANFRM